MKNISLILILVFLQNSFLNAQSKNEKNYGKVTYERLLNFDSNPKSTSFTLSFNPDFSIFYENGDEPKEKTTLKPSSDDEFDVSFDVKFNASKYIVMTDFNRDSIKSQVSLFRNGKEKNYIVEEKINKVKWDLINEFEIISNFKAQKAIGYFRGRKYIAWFTNEIPIKYGPWKLNGLPGLILKVSDDKNEVMFSAKLVNIPLNNNSTATSEFEFNKDFDKITLTEYVKYKNQQIDEVKKLFSSKLPRGAKMEMTNSKSNDIELVYEETVKE
jgi:GLPGLI family protein